MKFVGPPTALDALAQVPLEAMPEPTRSLFAADQIEEEDRDPHGDQPAEQFQRQVIDPKVEEKGHGIAQHTGEQHDAPIFICNAKAQDR